MPTKQDLDDAELSVLLSKAEPPKSPQHVDDYILAYARAQAAASEPGSRWQFLALGKNWLNQNWISAVATISVAVIAVSLSFQNFAPPTLDEIALTTTAGRGVADFDVELDAPAGLRVQATQALLAVNELSVAEEANPAEALKVGNANLPTAPQSVVLNDSTLLENRSREANLESTLSTTAAAPSTLERAEQPVSLNDAIAGVESPAVAGLDQDASTATAVDTVSLSRLLAADDNGNGAATAVADELAQTRVAQRTASVVSIASLQEEVGDSVVEELEATGSVRTNAQAAVSPAAATRPRLDTLLAAGPAAQQSLIEMLTRVLIDPDQNEFAMSAPLMDLIAPLISAYNQLADGPTVAAVADRYREARLGFTAFDLPLSLAELMDFLQTLE